MSRNQKLLTRIKKRPKDFTYNELRTLLVSFDCIESVKGKTSGSRVAFVHGKSKRILVLHKPHPNNELKQYQIDEVLRFIELLEVNRSEKLDEI